MAVGSRSESLYLFGNLRRNLQSTCIWPEVDLFSTVFQIVGTCLQI